jgi:hypothetical protein
MILSRASGTGGVPMMIREKIGEDELASAEINTENRFS